MASLPFASPRDEEDELQCWICLGGEEVRVMCVQGMSLDVIYPEWVANPLANNS